MMSMVIRAMCLVSILTDREAVKVVMMQGLELVNVVPSSISAVVE